MILICFTHTPKQLVSFFREFHLIQIESFTCLCRLSLCQHLWNFRVNFLVSWTFMDFISYHKPSWLLNPRSTYLMTPIPFSNFIILSKTLGRWHFFHHETDSFSSYNHALWFNLVSSLRSTLGTYYVNCRYIFHFCLTFWYTSHLLDLS